MLTPLVYVEAGWRVDGHGARLAGAQREHRHHQRLVGELAVPAAQRAAAHPARHRRAAQSVAQHTTIKAKVSCPRQSYSGDYIYLRSVVQM